MSELEQCPWCGEEHYAKSGHWMECRRKPVLTLHEKPSKAELLRRFGDKRAKPFKKDNEGEGEEMTTAEQMIDSYLDEKKWSADVKTKWEPPAGFFKQSGSKIASGLLSASKDKKQAMSRLNFFANRMGKNIPAEMLVNIEKAKEIISKSNK